MRFVLVLSVLASLATAANAQETSYQLTCNGGGDMQVTVSVRVPEPHEALLNATGGRLGGLSNVRQNFFSEMRVNFLTNPNFRGIDNSLDELDFTHCSWQDRPVSAQEPNVIAHAQHNLPGRAFILEARADGSLATVTTTGPCPTDNDVRHIIGRILSNELFDVMAYNNGEGQLVVTDVLRGEDTDIPAGCSHGTTPVFSLRIGRVDLGRRP